MLTCYHVFICHFMLFIEGFCISQQMIISVVTWFYKKIQYPLLSYWKNKAFILTKSYIVTNSDKPMQVMIIKYCKLQRGQCLFRFRLKCQLAEKISEILYVKTDNNSYEIHDRVTCSFQQNGDSGNKMVNIISTSQWWAFVESYIKILPCIETF